MGELQGEIMDKWLILRGVVFVENCVGYGWDL